MKKFVIVSILLSIMVQSQSFGAAAQALRRGFSQVSQPVSRYYAGPSAARGFATKPGFPTSQGPVSRWISQKGGQVAERARIIEESARQKMGATKEYFTRVGNVPVAKSPVVPTVGLGAGLLGLGIGTGAKEKWAEMRAQWAKEAEAQAQHVDRRYKIFGVKSSRDLITLLTKRHAVDSIKAALNDPQSGVTAADVVQVLVDDPWVAYNILKSSEGVKVVKTLGEVDPAAVASIINDGLRNVKVNWADIRFSNDSQRYAYTMKQLLGATGDDLIELVKDNAEAAKALAEQFNAIQKYYYLSPTDMKLISNLMLTNPEQLAPIIAKGFAPQAVDHYINQSRYFLDDPEKVDSFLSVLLEVPEAESILLNNVGPIKLAKIKLFDSQQKEKEQKNREYLARQIWQAEQARKWFWQRESEMPASRLME